MTTHTDSVTIRPGISMELETPAVVKRPGTPHQLREVRIRCDAATPSTVVLTLRGSGPNRWHLDRAQLTRALTGDTTSQHPPALGEITVALSGDKVVVSRRARTGATTVWVPVRLVEFFVDLAECLDHGAPR